MCPWCSGNIPPCHGGVGSSNLLGHFIWPGSLKGESGGLKIHIGWFDSNPGHHKVNSFPMIRGNLKLDVAGHKIYLATTINKCYCG